MTVLQIALCVTLFISHITGEEISFEKRKLQSCGDKDTGFRKRCGLAQVESFLGYEQLECYELSHQIPINGRVAFGMCCEECTTRFRDLLVTSVKIPENDDDYDTEPQAKIIRIKAGCSC